MRLRDLFLPHIAVYFIHANNLGLDKAISRCAYRLEDSREYQDSNLSIPCTPTGVAAFILHLNTVKIDSCLGI
jgi:hypothetical protein